MEPLSSCLNHKAAMSVKYNGKHRAMTSCDAPSTSMCLIYLVRWTVGSVLPSYLSTIGSLNSGGFLANLIAGEKGLLFTSSRSLLTNPPLMDRLTISANLSLSPSCSPRSLPSICPPSPCELSGVCPPWLSVHPSNAARLLGC